MEGRIWHLECIPSCTYVLRARLRGHLWAHQVQPQGPSVWVTLFSCPISEWWAYITEALSPPQRPSTPWSLLAEPLWVLHLTVTWSSWNVFLCFTANVFFGYGAHGVSRHPVPEGLHPHLHQEAPRWPTPGYLGGPHLWQEGHRHL